MTQTSKYTDEPVTHSIQGLSLQGFHKVAYTEWGDRDNPNVLVCVHGLSRNSRDFDYLARALQKKFRVICPDLVGRGDSERTGNPATYNVIQYINDMVALIARINTKEINYLGTSLGGIIGMILASQPHTPIKKLIINDVGLIVPKGGVKRIVTYSSVFPQFSTLEDAQENMRIRLATFGIQDPEHWNYILKHSIQQDPDGLFRFRYDPAVVKAFAGTVQADTHLDHYWKLIKCPVLVVHGEESDILTPDIIKQMVDLKPDTQVATIPNCGHAPALMSADQIEIIEEWLSSAI